MHTSPLFSETATSVAGWRPCGVGHVAVYGTLRAGGVNDIARLQPGLRCLGRTVLQGSLYDLGWYPGLTLQGTQQVLAEVYPITPALEQQLDGIEGLWPTDVGEYTKRIVTLPVALASGGMQTMPMLVYEALPQTVADARQIDADDWLAWFQSRGMGHLQGAFELNSVQNRK